jgi:amidase
VVIGAAAGGGGTVSTFITRFDTTGDGVRLAVKDLIDMEGVPTTAGSRAVADDAKPAEADAPCLAGARAAGARIVGKANLHELACGSTGLNPWFGNPVNPLDPSLVPGGSSSGSAVAVATDEADVAYGSDTGGSVRMPSACCGTTGLKTTWGRISLEGVWPLAPTLDTIGPMARDMAGVILGMQLLEPGFAVAASAATTVGRVGLESDPLITAALDAALGASELSVENVDLPGWFTAFGAAGAALAGEALASNRGLDRSKISDDVNAILDIGETVTDAARAEGRAAEAAWKQELATIFERVELLVLPTMPIFPPKVDEEADVLRMVAGTIPVNLAGVPALALPVPCRPFPASLQLVGPQGSEELLCATGLVLEAAARSRR